MTQAKVPLVNPDAKDMAIARAADAIDPKGCHYPGGVYALIAYLMTACGFPMSPRSAQNCASRGRLKLSRQ